MKTERPFSLSQNYFTNGFPGAEFNQHKRVEMAQPLSQNPFANNINIQSKEMVGIIYALYGIGCSLHYWFLNRVEFSNKHTLI